ncbi:MAG: pyridoxal phosphate-dependent aminotransferase [Chloroflexota bacterium]
MALDTACREDVAAAWDALSVAGLRRRGTLKWTFHGDDVLAAWVAEMDGPLAAVVQAALQEAIERSATGYPPNIAHSGLPAACAGWLSRSFGLEVEPTRIRLVPDVLHGLAAAIQAFSPPGSAVLLMTPAYPPFMETVRALGRPLVEVPLVASAGRWTFDLAAIDAALRAGAGTVVLCSPHNPLGRVFTREELEGLAAVVAARGARVVADEAHSPLVYAPATHVSYSTVSDDAARHSVTITSASKGWNLPGLKCAEVVLTNPADAAPWDSLPFLATYGASILGIEASKAAFEGGEPWLPPVVAYLDGNRKLLSRLVAELLPQVRYAPPEGTYLAWLDCRALGLDAPAAFFLQHARVALSEGAPFGLPGQGHVRLNIATSRAILTSSVEAMAGALRRAASTAPAAER